MRKYTFLLLALLFISGHTFSQTVVELPRPNSESFSFEEAEERMDEIYDLSPSGMAGDWVNPHLGFCVHIDKDDEITVYSSYFGEGSMTFEELTDLLEVYSGILSGCPIGVLITSSCDPEGSIVFPRVVELLFKPYVQIFYVKNS